MKKNEEKRITLDLRHVELEQDIDRFATADLSKAVGNLVHQRAADIGIDDKARELYHGGTVDLDGRELAVFKAIVEQSDLVYYVKSTLLKVMEELTK